MCTKGLRLCRQLDELWHVLAGSLYDLLWHGQSDLRRGGPRDAEASERVRLTHRFDVAVTLGEEAASLVSDGVAG